MQPIQGEKSLKSLKEKSKGAKLKSESGQMQPTQWNVGQIRWEKKVGSVQNANKKVKIGYYQVLGDWT